MNKLIHAAICFAATSALCSASAPTGSLNVDKSVARSGFVPTLSWDIDYPVNDLDTVVDIGGGGGAGEDEQVRRGATVETKTRLKVEVFMVGTAVSNHRVQTQTYVQLNGKWELVYQGFGLNIDSDEPSITRIVSSGSEIKFAARHSGGAFYTNTSENVLVMTDGARPTSTAGWGGDTSLEDYVRPYLGSDGAFDLGNFDVMFAAELTHTQNQISQAGYDSNDSIVLVRFTPVD